MILKVTYYENYRVARRFFLYHAQMCVIFVNFPQITRIPKFYLIAKLSKSRTSLHTAIFKSRAQGFRLRTNWRYPAHSGNSGTEHKRGIHMDPSPVHTTNITLMHYQTQVFIVRIQVKTSVLVGRIEGRPKTM